MTKLFGAFVLALALGALTAGAWWAGTTGALLDTATDEPVVARSVREDSPGGHTRLYYFTDLGGRSHRGGGLRGGK